MAEDHQQHSDSQGTSMGTSSRNGIERVQRKVSLEHGSASIHRSPASSHAMGRPSVMSGFNGTASDGFHANDLLSNSFAYESATEAMHHQHMWERQENRRRFPPMMPHPYYPPAHHGMHRNYGNREGISSLRPSVLAGDFGHPQGASRFASSGMDEMLEFEASRAEHAGSHGMNGGLAAILEEEAAFRSVTRKRKPTSGANFPTKLHKILADPEYHDYVDWLPHGRAWRILKPKAFETDVLPLFFRSKRYASFMRQVNGWGFKRITEGPDLNAYYHELFLRGMPKLCHQMKRTTTKGKGGTDFTECPDFYKISMFAPLPEPDVPKSQVLDTPKTVVTKDSAVSNVNPKRPSSPSSVSTMSGSVDALRQEAEAIYDPSPRTPERNSPAPFAASFPSPSNAPISLNDALTGSPLQMGGGGNSSSNSLGSWGSPPEDFGSPSHSNMFANAGHHPSAAQRTSTPGSGGQVTPPSSHRPFTSPMAPQSGMTDSSGLSVADLQYLTQQNRVLLRQARGGSAGSSSASS